MKTALNEEVRNITRLIKKINQNTNKKTLLEQKWENTSANNDTLIDSAKKYADVISKSFNTYYNTILTLSILDIINDMERYSEMVVNLDSIYKTNDNKIEYYYKTIESYDFFDRPTEIETLENVVNDISDTSNNLRDLYYSLDGMLDAAKTISKMTQENVIKINENKKIKK
jgi:hypothetical protein